MTGAMARWLRLLDTRSGETTVVRSGSAPALNLLGASCAEIDTAPAVRMKTVNGLHPFQRFLFNIVATSLSLIRRLTSAICDSRPTPDAAPQKS
jgi:hypothetical protein